MCYVKSEHWGSREETETGDWKQPGRKEDKERLDSEVKTTGKDALEQWSLSCGPYSPQRCKDTFLVLSAQ